MLHGIDFWILIPAIIIVLFISTAAIQDIRTRRIPNRLTVSMFLGGVLYALLLGSVHGMRYAVSPALGFVAGFGILYLLWLFGAVGGGDVKLMGALGIWLGLKLTLYVFVLSTVVIVVTAAGLAIARAIRRTINSCRSRIASTEVSPPLLGQSPPVASDRSPAPGIPYAAPVAAATWMALVADLVLRY
jgi:prepilin peptidase CpaA